MDEIPANSECNWLEKAFDFFSKKWMARTIYLLSGEPRRFGDLKRELKGVSAKVLSQRLRALEKAGIVSRSERSTRPLNVEYQLTENGQAIMTIIHQLHELKMKLTI